MSSPLATLDGPQPARQSLRVAICLPALEPLRQMLDQGWASDGTYVVQGYVAGGLRERGHRLTFVACREGDVECARELAAPTRVERTWSARPWFDVASRAAWRAQQWLRIPYLNVFSNYRLLDACLQCLPGHDVAYERNALYFLGVARACRRIGLPYVMFFEADQLMELQFTGRPVPKWLQWRAGRILRYNLDAAACIICVSDPARRHLVDTWGANPVRTVVCPNGVDVSRFRPDGQARADVRRSLGLGDRPVVMFVGSFFEWHDTGTLLDAFARVLARVPDGQLLLAGDGRLREAMQQRAAAAGLGDAVRFMGLMSHSDVPRLLSAADVTVAPYPRMDRELWLSPLKLFEYMASGTAIVASRAGQVGQVIRDGSNGLLVPPGDVPAMADAIEALLTGPQLRLQLGARARADALREHAWERYIGRLEALLQAVVDRRPVDRV